MEPPLLVVGGYTWNKAKHGCCWGHLWRCSFGVLGMNIICTEKMAMAQQEK